MDIGDLELVQHFKIINDDNCNDLSDDARHARTEACRDACHKYQRMRGTILTYAVELEVLMTKQIAKYFVPQGGEARDRFVISILGREFCSFNSKLAILKDMNQFLDEKEKGEHPSWTAIQKLATIRNRFAHGRFVIDWITLDVSLEHAKGCDDAMAQYIDFGNLYATARLDLVVFGRRMEKA